MTNELAVVEAPRVRELGLYEQHTADFVQHYGEQASSACCSSSCAAYLTPTGSPGHHDLMT